MKNKPKNIRNSFWWRPDYGGQSVICLLVFFIGLYCSASANNMLDVIEKQAVDSAVNVGDTIYQFGQVENEAEYSGGQICFLRDFSKALDLSGVNESDYRTRIAAEFVITADGSLIIPRILGDDLNTVKPIADYTPFDYAIIRALSKLNNGKWEAATRNGIPVSSYYKIVTHIDYNQN